MNSLSERWCILGLIARKKKIISVNNTPKISRNSIWCVFVMIFWNHQSGLQCKKNRWSGVCQFKTLSESPHLKKGELTFLSIKPGLISRIFNKKEETHRCSSFLSDYESNANYFRKLRVQAGLPADLDFQRCSSCSKKPITVEYSLWARDTRSISSF